VTDHTIAAILNAKPSFEELEVAAAYVRGEGDTLDRLGHAMTGKISQLYAILTADELYANNSR
jgi:hypothetical protein